MKPALQALLISPDKKSRKNILAEKKTVTIREGHRDYHPGTAMLCCHIDPWAVMVEIVSVRRCRLSEVTNRECRDDGYQSHEEMEKDLKRYYPEITAESPVTIIRWRVPQGKLVKDYWAKKARKGGSRK